MNNTTNKSANQLYKESGSTLSFKDWIEREKMKGVEIPNTEANAALISMMNEAGELQTKNTEEPNNKKVIIFRNIVIAASIVTLGYFAFKIYNKKNNE